MDGVRRYDYRSSFIRMFDPGGLVLEGKERYEAVDGALNEAEAGIATRMGT